MLIKGAFDLKDGLANLFEYKVQLTGVTFTNMD